MIIFAPSSFFLRYTSCVVHIIIVKSLVQYFCGRLRKISQVTDETSPGQYPLWVITPRTKPPRSWPLLCCRTWVRIPSCGSDRVRSTGQCQFSKESPEALLPNLHLRTLQGLPLLYPSVQWPTKELPSQNCSRLYDFHRFGFVIEAFSSEVCFCRGGDLSPIPAPTNTHFVPDRRTASEL